MGTQTQWGPRIYGNRTNNTWTEKICDSDGSNCKTETYYTTVQDPGDGGPFGASGDLAGKTTIYKRNDGFIGWLTGQSGDEVVGEIHAYGPNKGKLINNAPFKSAELERRIAHFSKPDNLKRAKNQAILTVKKGQMADKDVYGNDIEPITDDPDVSDKLARKLLDTGSALKDGDGDTKDGDGDTKDIADDNKDRAGTNRDFGKDLRYPITMSDTQDTLKIDMVEYTAKGFKSKGGQWGGADRSKAGEGDRKIIGTVVLPIPGGIKDADKVNWSEDSMNAMQIALSDFASSSIEGGKEGAKKSKLKGLNAGPVNNNSILGFNICPEDLAIIDLKSFPIAAAVNASLTMSLRFAPPVFFIAAIELLIDFSAPFPPPSMLLLAKSESAICIAFKLFSDQPTLSASLIPPGIGRTTVPIIFLSPSPAFDLSAPPH